VQIGMEGIGKETVQHHRNFRDYVNVVYYDFLEQVNDLLNDSTIFSDINNFISMIDMNDPFGNKRPPQNGLIDEVHDAKWYQDTVIHFGTIANGEPYLLLPIIGYVDKTGTDVNQRNKVELFSFTLSILNCQCQFTSKAWQVLGFVPNLEHKSLAAITRGRSGHIGKGKTSRNYHHCLSIILESFIRNQGLEEPVYGFVRIGDQVAR